jgi:hypothetical protein
MSERYSILHAAEAATQPLPQYISLNFANLFRIQRVSNPFPLRPISFSRLSSYLECPSCALEQQRKRRPKEPRHFTDIHQKVLFGGREPDPRLVGTLLHATVDLLHDPQGPLDSEQQTRLLAYPDVLTRFIRQDLLNALRSDGKVKLAMFYDELSASESKLRATVIEPLLGYQRELLRTGATVFASAERFQCKLLSTHLTFDGHSDWGGYVGLVGEFDQIRLHPGQDGQYKPAIMEFKKGLGKKRSWDRWFSMLDNPEAVLDATDDLLEPGLAHALQLMVYWLAFQTRWDILSHVRSVRGQLEDFPMSIEQELDLIIYNLHDGARFLLVPTDFQQAILAVTTCIFYLNWAMKSGYVWQSPEHECGKTSLLTDVPDPLVQVGYGAISAGVCYELARASFREFCELVRWQKLS